MIALLRFIASNAWLVSLVCLLGAARAAWKALAIYRARTTTPYALERESFVGEVGRVWITAVSLAFIGLAVLIASPFILSSTADIAYEGGSAPPVAGILTRTPTPTALITPTLEVFATPVPEATATPLEAPVLPPTYTPGPTAVLTPVPLPPDCPDPRVQLGAPTTGQVLSGVVEVWGTADVPDFDFYKFEINGPLTGGEWWTTGDLAYTPVSSGILGYWDASPVVREAPGFYLFRLMVVDKTGNYPPPCAVQVRIGSE